MIPNSVCLLVALFGSFSLLLLGPLMLLKSVLGAAVLFLLLLLAHTRGLMGGGDVKLLTALALGLPVTRLVELLFVTTLAGGVLAALHLTLRLLPYPQRPPPGSFILRRIWAVERWRALRRAPLPYGVAIACGGIWTVLGHGA